MTTTLTCAAGRGPRLPPLQPRGGGDAGDAVPVLGGQPDGVTLRGGGAGVGQADEGRRQRGAIRKPPADGRP